MYSNYIKLNGVEENSMNFIDNITKIKKFKTN